MSRVGEFRYYCDGTVYMQPGNRGYEQEVRSYKQFSLRCSRLIWQPGLSRDASSRFPQLEYVAVFVRRFSEWFERVTTEVGSRHGGERIQTPGVSVAELSAAIGLPPTLPYERLCKLGFEASCNVQEILTEQGAAGWGAASLLAAEKLCWRCMDMLTAKPEDYRIVVRSGDRGSFSSFGRGGRGRGRGGFGNGAARRGGGGSGGKEASFHIWCLNSAVSFVPVAEQARCVIITSGTLAPMAVRSSKRTCHRFHELLANQNKTSLLWQGMQGELGASFPLKLEAQHVIPSRQLHVEALAELGEVVYKNYSGHRGAAFNDQLGGEPGTTSCALETSGNLKTSFLCAIDRDTTLAIASYTKWFSVFFLLLFVNGEGSRTLARCAPWCTYLKHVPADDPCTQVVVSIW
eukprot:COSAG02_NODE_2802_length_8002_cov_11.765532_3_plen_404_part_00